MRTKKDIEQFIDTAFSAYAAGALAANNTDDGGTCCNDFVVLKMRYGSKKAVEILKRVGLPAYLHKRGVVHVYTPFGGQALKHELAVEAICKTFARAELNDLETFVYSLID